MHRSLWRFLALPVVNLGLLGMFCGSSLARAGEEPKTEYLSESLAKRIVLVQQDWGELGWNTAVKPSHKPAEKLRIKDTFYEHGLGHHANGEIVVDLAGQFKTFHADIGVQWQGGGKVASVIFRVFVDDQKVFESRVMGENDPPQSISIPVEDAEELRLVADATEDGITCDCANWAEARLVFNPDARATAVRPLRKLDMSRFGQVVTSDPARMTGTAARRTEEVPAADIRLSQEVLPQADGTYCVPMYGALGCIGLCWEENHLLRQVVLRFSNPAELPPPEKVQLQIWTGESAWQGEWKPVDTPPERYDDALIWAEGFPNQLRRTQKVRWIFSDVKKPIVLKSLEAYTQSRCAEMAVCIAAVQPRQATAQIEVYNGQILAPANGDAYKRPWDMTQPVVWQIRYCVPKPYKADRTVLRFSLPDTSLGVALEDLLTQEAVYVPHAGLYITRQPPPVSFQDYQAKIASAKGLLDQVRKQPDQSFAKALASVHNPVQNNGPMLVSLACDNRKFFVDRRGDVLFNSYTHFDQNPVAEPTQWRLNPQFQVQNRAEATITRHLAGGWLPIPVTIHTAAGVRCQQATGVLPLDAQASQGSPCWVRKQPVAILAFELHNEGESPADVSLRWTLTPGKNNAAQVAWERRPEGIMVVEGSRVLALLDVRKIGPLEVQMEKETATLHGKLPVREKATCLIYLPAWALPPSEAASVLQDDSWMSRIEQYWTEVLQGAVQVEVPDPLLTNVIRASQVHCLLAARNEDEGRRVAAWIASDRYGPLESEAHAVIRGMDMLGHTDFARRSLEFFIHRYNPAGFLTTGYTLVGTGEHLWTLAEHQQRTGDRAWAEKVAPEIARVCRWIIAQRAKTKLVGVRGERVPEFGLAPPGVSADWNRYAYRFFNDAQYCLGLEAAAQMLATVGHPEAENFLAEARQYREDILRAYRWMQARSPVVRLDNGTWVLPMPAMLGIFGRVEEFLPAEDANRSWCYHVEAGSHHLAATGILDPNSEEVGWMLDEMEEQHFLRTGWRDYPETENRKDPFGRGGFSKVQPYYTRAAELYAVRDDVKPFIRSYFNALASLLSLENLSLWEHFHNGGAWNKTHETGWFLCQTRVMLVQERGNELWLAPMVTTHWLHDGMNLSVRDAPTRFGKTSFTLRSFAAKGRIEAVVQPPNRALPKSIVLRLRHPEEKPIRTVTVNGKPHQDFDPQKSIVRLPGSRETFTVVAEF